MAPRATPEVTNFEAPEVSLEEVKQTHPSVPLSQYINSDDEQLQNRFREPIMAVALNRTFQELKNKDEDIRTKAAHELHAAAVTAHRGK